MNSRQGRPAVVFVALLAGLIGSVRANVVSASCVNAAISSGGGAYLGQSTCNTFDSSFGTLTDVTIHYFASVSAKISNESSLPLIAQVQGQFLFQEFPFSILTARSGIMSSSNAGVNAGQIGGPVASAHFDVGLAALSIPNSFDYFTGSPRTFSLQDQINQYHLDVSALASPWVVESRTGIAQISIDYTYTAAATPPTSVPEPGSFALVALSMGALGFVRLRRVGGRAHVASQSSFG